MTHTLIAPVSVNAYIGRAIRRRRKDLGWTQENLGDLLGLSFQQIHKYEIGYSSLSADRLHALAKLMGVSVTYFFPVPLEQAA